MNLALFHRHSELMWEIAPQGAMRVPAPIHLDAQQMDAMLPPGGLCNRAGALLRTSRALMRSGFGPASICASSD